MACDVLFDRGDGVGVDHAVGSNAWADAFAGGGACAWGFCSGTVEQEHCGDGCGVWAGCGSAGVWTVCGSALSVACVACEPGFAGTFVVDSAGGLGDGIFVLGMDCGSSIEVGTRASGFVVCGV